MFTDKAQNSLLIRILEHICCLERWVHAILVNVQANGDVRLALWIWTLKVFLSCTQSATIIFVYKKYATNIGIIFGNCVVLKSHSTLYSCDLFLAGLTMDIIKMVKYVLECYRHLLSVSDWVVNVNICVFGWTTCCIHVLRFLFWSRKWSISWVALLLTYNSFANANIDAVTNFKLFIKLWKYCDLLKAHGLRSALFVLF